MMDLTFGEFFVVTFIFLAVVSAPYWPRLGERVFVAFSGKSQFSSKPQFPRKPQGPDRD